MFARPMTSDLDIPEPGAIETETLDFKQAHKRDSFEMAKDVSALANLWGGTLLLGASEKPTSRLSGYFNIDKIDSVRRDYENATRDLCFPAPVYRFAELSRDGKALLAINIEPSRALIAVRQEKAWAFPIRRGSDTYYLTAQELPMYLDPATRRGLLLLDQIEPDEVVDLCINGLVHQQMRFHSVDERRNAVLFNKAGAAPNVSAPITGMINAWWREASQRWVLVFRDGWEL